MIEDEIIAVVKLRLSLATEDYISLEKCWSKETEILSRDIKQTITFIENECNDETFCWIGEVFDDVADITQSKEFIAAIKRRAEKVIDEKSRKHVEVDIRYAEYKID